MKQSKTKKFILKKITLSNLNHDEIKAINGGFTGFPGRGCDTMDNDTDGDLDEGTEYTDDWCGWF